MKWLVMIALAAAPSVARADASRRLGATSAPAQVRPVSLGYRGAFVGLGSGIAGRLPVAQLDTQRPLVRIDTTHVRPLREVHASYVLSTKHSVRVLASIGAASETHERVARVGVTLQF